MLFELTRRYLLQSPQPQPEHETASSSAATATDAAPPGSAQKQQQQQKEKQQKEKQQKEKQQAVSSSKDAVTVVQLGSVGVALWWEPTRHSHDLGVVERVSFCLLPGEVKVRKQMIVSACCCMNVLMYA